MNLAEDEALQSDAYIEALLAAQSWSGARLSGGLARATRQGVPGDPSGAGAIGLPGAIAPGLSSAFSARDPLAPDDELAVAAEVLARGLVRFHPSFRFEEALLSRLRIAAADASRRERDAGPGGRPTDHAQSTVLGAHATVMALPAVVPSLARPSMSLEELAGFDLGRAVERVPLPVLAASAIASGVSIAGAAYVAWRRTRRPA